MLWAGTETGLLICDSGNNTVRRLYFHSQLLTYSVETFAGQAGVSGAQDGSALDATFNSPVALAADPFSEGFFVTDLYNNKIRQISVGPTLPPLPAPQIGRVQAGTDVVGDPVLTLDPITSAVFNNDVTLAIEGTTGAEIYFTYGPTPLPGEPDTIPIPSATTGQTPPVFVSGPQPSTFPISIIEPQPDVTIKAIAIQPHRRPSPVAQARVQFKTSNPLVVGENAFSFLVTNSTVGATMYYTTNGVMPAPDNGSFGPFSGGHISFPLHTDFILNVRGFRSGYQPSAVVERAFYATNYSDLVNMAAPVISPASGYFPLGQSIVVTSTYPAFYTTDGTVPTTNSFPVIDGTIPWRNTTNDLTALRVRAFYGTNASPTAFGVRPDVNEIGVSSDTTASVGSTVLVPVVVNLRADAVLRSLQYRVEFTPFDDAPPVRPQLQAIDILTNDFVSVAGTTVSGKSGHYTAGGYEIPNPTNSSTTIPGGVSVYIIGPDANLEARDYGTVSMIAVPIAATAHVGQRYRIDVVQASATSDGLQNAVAITNMAPHYITITNSSYLVGDTSPGLWYNAGGFGDGDLNNNDVNNAFYATLGSRVPPFYTDAFDAMDVYPLDAADQVGGDGQIRFLDWQYILLRSLRHDTNNWLRFWTLDGHRTNQFVGDSVPAAGVGVRTKSTTTPAPGDVWRREALIASTPITWAAPGQEYFLPVNVVVSPGASVAGLSFRAMIETDAGAPTVTEIAFVPAADVPAPMTGSGQEPNEVLCGWPLVPIASFAPPLQGSNVIGSIRFRVPWTANAQQSYTLHFYNPDGAPNLTTQYNLESIPVSVWINSGALRPAERISEQWKTQFFATVANAEADDNADPDHDGLSNWMEYQAGTSPTNALSRLVLLRPHWLGGASNARELSWQTAPDKTYVVERGLSLGGPWQAVGSPVVGDGGFATFNDDTPSSRLSFYRIRLQ